MQARRKAIAVGWITLGLSGLFAACGTSSNDSTPGGVAASAGTNSGASSSGGTSAGQAPDAQAGESSSAPAGGSEQGSAAAGGMAGGPSSAGAPGAGGTVDVGEPTGGGPECMSDEDCAIFNDCCECDVGAVTEEHPECEKLCIQSACDARGVTAAARCRSKRCVFDLSCDRSSVTCKAAEPECPAGQIASVVDTCWGPCIEASQCREVTDCEDCAVGTVCVANEDSLLFSFRQCVEVESSCAAKPTCACVDACFSACNENEGIGCFCPVC